jgi:hypothetical protein
MNRTLQAAGSVVLVLAALAASASADNKQFGNYSRKPAVSPYMQLLNNQNGTATNYQSLVRPQLDQNSFNRQSASAIKQLQTQASRGPSQSGSEGNQKLRATGHRASRENYSHYFPAMKQK